MIKTNYDRYKEKGICVRCGKDEAMINSYHCPDCAEKKAIQESKYWRRMKKDREYINKIYAKNREQYKKRDKKRDEAGLCVKCGKRSQRQGSRWCIDCITKLKRFYKNKNGIPRSERVSYGLCYFCGEPKWKKYKVCEKHYKILADGFKWNVATEKRKEAREKRKNFNKIIFIRK